MRARLVAVLLLVALGAPAARAVDPAPRLVVLGRTGKVPSQIVLRNVAATTSVRLLVPAGYGLLLGQDPGSVRGAAAAQVADSAVRLGGIVEVAPAGTAACDGQTHSAIWTLQLSDGKQVVTTVVIAADAAPAALLVCTGGTNVAQLTLQLSTTTLTPPAQASRPVWEALLSLTDGSQVASVATLAIPTKVTLTARLQRAKHALALSGTVLEAGAPAPEGRRVVVSVGTRPTTLTVLGATRTKPDGSWRGLVTNVKRTVYVQAQAVAPELDTTATACTPPTLTAPCVSATTAGYAATSPAVRVVVARR